MEETKKAKILKILQDEASVKELANKTSLKEFENFFNEKGIELVDEDFTEIQETALEIEKMIRNGELTEKTLEEISGGFLDSVPALFDLTKGISYFVGKDPSVTKIGVTTASLVLGLLLSVKTAKGLVSDFKSLK